MRYKDVQNRKELSPDTIGIKVNIELDTQLTEVSSLLFLSHNLTKCVALL